MLNPYVYIEPSDPEDPNSRPIVYSAKTLKDAEYNSPFVMTREEFDSLPSSSRSKYILSLD